MVDNIESQTIQFSGQENKQALYNKDIMDIHTQNALIESTKNFNKLANDMMTVCSNICIKNFYGKNLDREETNCVENCQKNFFSSYAMGKQFVDIIIQNVNKTDLFENKSDIDIIQSSVDSVKFNKI